MELLIGMFTLYAHDWKVEMVLSFYEQLYSTQIWHGEVDRLVWNLSKRSFEVKTFYGALACQDAALGKILTHDNLCRRYIVVVEWCCMCKKNGESIDNLLLHCGVARV